MIGAKFLWNSPSRAAEYSRMSADGFRDRRKRRLAFFCTAISTNWLVIHIRPLRVLGGGYFGPLLAKLLSKDKSSRALLVG